MQPQNFPGLIKDPRSQEEKSKDLQHHHLFAAVPVTWIEKTQDQWKKYSIRDQDGSSSCVGQGNAKALEVLTGVIQSAHPVYRRRSNYPSEGMWLENAGDILMNQGTTSEALDPSQLLNEQEMDADVTVSTPLTIHDKVFINPPTDIDSIAAVVSQGFGVAVCFDLYHGEWLDVPTVIPGSTYYSGHCVCAVDFTLYNGQKALVIEDSWGHATSLGNGGQRIITQAFLQARCTGAMYLLPKAPLPPKPQHIFNTDLVFGNTGPEVYWLQRCLADQGFLDPSWINADPNAAFFGTHTLQAVIAFQNKYAQEIIVPAHSPIATGKVMQYTRAKLNQLYAS